MNILLITDPYPPEVRAISYMMQELADGLVARGHQVTVVTSWPQRNLSRDEESQHFPECREERGVRVVRVKSPSYFKIGYLARGLIQLNMPRLFLAKIKKYLIGKPDVVVIYSPPLPLGQLGAQIKKTYGAAFVLNVQDIFPQNAIDLGILTNKLLIKFYERMEQDIYRNTDKMTAHTENSTQFLIEHKHVPADKITTVTNWIDTQPYQHAQATGRFRRQYHLEGKFIILFAGIMGPSQNLDFILEVAGQLNDIPELCFLLVGEGSEKSRLQALAKERNLTNVQFEAFISPAEYPCLAKDSYLGLMCLSGKNKTPVIPGKLLGFMAAGLPVVAFLQPESDGHRLIQESRCGYSLDSDNVMAAADLIRKIYREKDTLAPLGQNGFNFVQTHFTKDICIHQLERIITGAQK